jgi:hypothetical protein
MTYEAHVQDALYARCSQAIADAGRERESLFLARLVLLLFEQLDDEQACCDAIDAAARDLPMPSLSAD